MRFSPVTLRLPNRVDDLLADPDRVYPTAEDRMRFAIEPSRANVRRGTGGPFRAAVFDRGKGKLLAPGVDLVVLASKTLLSSTRRWWRS